MTEIRSAVPELVSLAATVRADWDRDETRNAIVAAKTAGWTWTATCRYVMNLMLREDSSPAELRHAAASPIRRDTPLDRADAPVAAAKARDLYPNLRTAPPKDAA